MGIPLQARRACLYGGRTYQAGDSFEAITAMDAKLLMTAGFAIEAPAPVPQPMPPVIVPTPIPAPEPTEGEDPPPPKKKKR